MYIDEVPNRKSRPAILLREGWREGGKVKKRTIANLTNWPPTVVEAIRIALKNKTVVAFEDAFAIERSLPHGHVEAILSTIKKLDLDKMLASKRSRQRDLILCIHLSHFRQRQAAVIKLDFELRYIAVHNLHIAGEAGAYLAQWHR